MTVPCGSVDFLELVPVLVGFKGKPKGNRPVVWGRVVKERQTHIGFVSDHGTICRGPI